jgi:predicted DsbA family dithiol-disulfide isomerase
MELVVYGDFNCPYSCLASARADILVERGIAAVEWRAVEHDPSIPLPSEPVDGDLAVALDREVSEVSGLLRADETFPIRRPPVHPNSAAAVAVFAASPPDGSSQLRRSLFGALWFEGRDIGDRTVLAALGAEEGDDTQRAAAWRAEWLRFDRRVVPMLVLPDGYVSCGLGALGRLADLASGSAAPRRSAADPGRRA